MQYDSIVIMGGPGSGKSTQAKFLKEKTGFRLFSPGERYREIAQEDSPFGKRIKEIIDSGHLGPHWLSIYLFQEAILNLTDAEGIIFEGIARKIEEAKAFNETMEWFNRTYMVLDVKVGEEEIIKRLNLRRETGLRADDDEEDIPVRIREYEEYTEPSLSFFNSLGKLKAINGEQSEADVHAEILNVLA